MNIYRFSTMPIRRDYTWSKTSRWSSAAGDPSSPRSDRDAPHDALRGVGLPTATHASLKGCFSDDNGSRFPQIPYTRQPRIFF